VLLRRLRLRRLRRLRRLPPPELLLPLALDRAGATCVNFAISSASCFAEPHRPYDPYDAARTLEPH
jgi:hypothetical protein